MRFLVLVLALAFAAPTVASAQVGPRQQQRRDRIKHRIQALRDSELIAQLGLDEQTAGKLLLVLGKYDDQFEKLLVERQALMKRLRSATEQDPKPVLEHTIDDAIANQHALWDLQEKRLAELRKILTPAQTARLVIVLPAVEQKIQRQLRRAIRAGRAGGGGAGPAGPAGGDDSDDDGP